MARKKRDEDVEPVETAPTTDQQPPIDPAPVGDETPEPISDAPVEELTPPCVAFNLLREKNPGLYPDWEGLTDKEREAFVDLFNRANDEDVQGNHFVECAKEVLNV